MDWGLDWDWTEVFLSGGGALGSKNLSLVEEAELVGLVCCFWSWSAAFKLMGDSLETIVTYTSRLTITRLRGLKGAIYHCSLYMILCVRDFCRCVTLCSLVYSVCLFVCHLIVCFKISKKAFEAQVTSESFLFFGHICSKMFEM